MADHIQLDGRTYVPIAEAASIVRVSESRVHALAGEGRVFMRSMGKKVYVDLAGLRAALASKPAPEPMAVQAAYAEPLSRPILPRVARVKEASVPVIPEKEVAREVLAVSEESVHSEVPQQIEESILSPVASIPASRGHIVLPVRVPTSAPAATLSPARETVRTPASVPTAVALVPEHTGGIEIPLLHAATTVAAGAAFAVVLTAGTFAWQYAPLVSHTIASAGARAVAAASTSYTGIDLLADSVYRTICPYVSSCEGEEENVVPLEVERESRVVQRPSAPAVVNSVPTTPAPAAVATTTVRRAPSAPIAQTIINNPVVERVIIREIPSPQVNAGISPDIEARFRELERRIASASPAIFSSPSPVMLSPSFAAGERIDRLTGVSISGGTISGATVSGGSVTASSIVGTITNTIESALATITSLTATDAIFTRATSTDFFATNAVFTRATSTDFVATNATTTNLYVTNLSAPAFSTTNLTWTNATGTNLVTTAATTTYLSVYGRSAFGGTSTTTIDSTGAITVASTGYNTFPYASTTAFTVAQDAYLNRLNITGVITSTATGYNTFPYASSTAFTASTIAYFGTASTTNLTISGIQNGILATDATGIVAATTTPTATYFISTGTTASRFPYASSTALTATNGFFSTASTTSFTLSGTRHAILGTDGSGTVSATTSIGSGYIIGTLGTVNGTTFARGDSITITAASSTLLADSNVWSALQRLTSASSSQLSVFTKAYFGGTATSTFNSDGSLSMVAPITSTATSYNTFPYASTTALSVSGTAYFPGTGIWNSSGNVGVGTTNPTTGKLEVSKSTPGQAIYSVNNSTSGTNYGIDAEATGSGGTLNIGAFFAANGATSNSAIRLQSGYPPAGANNYAIESLSDAKSYFAGNVGIGTTSPFRKLSVTDAVATAQAALSYDTTRNTDFLTDSSGDLVINPSGDDARLNDDNLWVCAGGACPSGTPSGNGNLIVETKIGIGTSTPYGTLAIKQGTNSHLDNGLVIARSDTTDYSSIITGGDNFMYLLAPSNQIKFADTSASVKMILNSSGYFGVGTTTPTDMLSVQGLLRVGANSNSTVTAGTATSTFNGDIRILGKLDVATIDPVYAIGGTKYATYGHSTVGVKEEAAVKVVPTVWIAEKNMYAYVIDFSSLPKGSDLWLFYQITDFGSGWENLVVSLAPAFAGSVYYEENIAQNTLTIYASHSAPVSLRVIANRYDFSKWGNVRPDQDDDFTHFTLPEKK